MNLVSDQSQSLEHDAAELAVDQLDSDVDS